MSASLILFINWISVLVQIGKDFVNPVTYILLEIQLCTLSSITSYSCIFIVITTSSNIKSKMTTTG